MILELILYPLRHTQLSRKREPPSFNTVLRSGLIPALPLHVAGLVRAAPLQRDDVVDHEAGAGIGSFVSRRAWIRPPKFPAGRRLLAIRPLASRAQDVQYAANRCVDRLWAPTERLAGASARREDRPAVLLLASAAIAIITQTSEHTRRIKYLAFMKEECVRPGNLLNLCSLFLRYDGEVGNARTCAVSFVDSDGIRHTVEVAAESLYEAAALAVKEFRRHPWSDGMEPGAVTTLAVTVKSPATTHELSIRQLERWVKGTAKSPHDVLLKGRVRELLDSK